MASGDNILKALCMLMDIVAGIQKPGDYQPMLPSAFSTVSLRGNCPAGFEVHDDQCVRVVFAVPNETCPKDAMMTDEGRCESFMRKTISCPGASYVLDGAYCVAEKTAPADLSCHPGFKLSIQPKQCVKQVKLPDKILCPKNSAMRNGHCLESNVAPATANCPKGFNLNYNGMCEGQHTKCADPKQPTPHHTKYSSKHYDRDYYPSDPEYRPPHHHHAQKEYLEDMHYGTKAAPADGYRPLASEQLPTPRKASMSRSMHEQPVLDDMDMQLPSPHKIKSLKPARFYAQDAKKYKQQQYIEQQSPSAYSNPYLRQPYLQQPAYPQPYFQQKPVGERSYLASRGQYPPEGRARKKRYIKQLLNEKDDSLGGEIDFDSAPTTAKSRKNSNRNNRQQQGNISESPITPSSNTNLSLTAIVPTEVIKEACHREMATKKGARGKFNYAMEQPKAQPTFIMNETVGPALPGEHHSGEMPPVPPRHQTHCQTRTILKPPVYVCTVEGSILTAPKECTIIREIPAIKEDGGYDEQTEAATVLCPSPYTLSLIPKDVCVFTDRVPAVFTCPPGYEDASDGHGHGQSVCVIYTHPEYSCPTNYTLQGKQCTRTLRVSVGY